MKIVYLGDIYGEKGLKALEKFLPKLKETYPHDLLIANGENVSDGLGLKQVDYKTLMKLGVRAITLGNHAFSKDEIFDYIEDANIVRPMNYPKNTPGKTVLKINFNGKHICILQVMGQVFMNGNVNNPFESLDETLKTVSCDYILVDVHAEATSEKLAVGHFLDGRVNAVLGTHTHVPTNDAMRLPKGTLYQTDVGMCGVKYGILGADKDRVMHKFLTGMPTRLRPHEANVLQLNATYVDLEKNEIHAIQYID